MSKEYYRSLIGKKVQDVNKKREGVLVHIQFHSANWKYCWYVFKWSGGAYCVQSDEIELLPEPEPTTVHQLSIF